MLEILILLFTPIVLGAVAARLGNLPKNSAKILNSFLFNVSIPVTIFVVISSLNFEQIVGFIKFILANFLSISLGLIVSYVILNKIVFDKIDAISAVLSASAGNVLLFGLPVTNLILGPQAEIYTIIYTLPFFLAVTLVGIPLIQISTKKRVKLFKIISSLVKNPIMIANMFGFIFLILSRMQLLTLTEEILEPLRLISGTTIPLALFSIGFYLSKNFEFRYLRVVFSVTLGKFLLIPTITLTILTLFVMAQDAYKVSVLLSLMPTATLAVVLTDEYKLNSKISSSSILVTALLFFFMLPFIILVLRSF